jgi:ADP-heptose:LPS heptosyltransferase
MILRIKASLLRFFTAKKTKNFDIKNVEEILFFRYDRIGDMIITTPVFRELKLFLPNIKISVLASKANHSVLNNNPFIDKVYLNDKHSFLSDLKILFNLRKKNFDACIEFDHSVIPHAIIRLKIINPKIVISVSKEGRYGVDGQDLKLYDFYTRKKNNSHFRDIWLETLSPFNITPKSSHYDLFCSSSQNEKAQKFVNQFKGNFLIGINLEGAVKGKKIEDEDLMEICISLHEIDNNIRIIILSAPTNFQSIKKMVGNLRLDFVLMSYETKNILDVAALINKLDLIISPDTSIVHIASTFNKPIVSIHENNIDSYELFAPISKLNKTIFSKSANSLNGFSVGLLIEFCLELINLIKNDSQE